MKPVLKALLAVACVVAPALPAVAAPVVGAAPTAAAAVYKRTATGYWYKGKFYRYARTTRKAAAPVARAVRATGAKTYALPDQKPHYDAGGGYLPTTFLYQETNGEFKILAPGAAPVASAAPGTRPGATRPGAAANTPTGRAANIPGASLPGQAPPPPALPFPVNN